MMDVLSPQTLARSTYRAVTDRVRVGDGAEGTYELGDHVNRAAVDNRVDGLPRRRRGDAAADAVSPDADAGTNECSSVTRMSTRGLARAALAISAARPTAVAAGDVRRGGRGSVASPLQPLVTGAGMCTERADTATRDSTTALSVSDALSPRRRGIARTLGDNGAYPRARIVSWTTYAPRKRGRNEGTADVGACGVERADSRGHVTSDRHRMTWASDASRRRLGDGGGGGNNNDDDSDFAAAATIELEWSPMDGAWWVGAHCEPVGGDSEGAAGRRGTVAVDLSADEKR